MNKTEIIDAATGKSENQKEKLEEIEERYSTLVDHIVEGVLIVQDSIIKFANRRLAEMSGYTIEELIGMPILSLVTPESVPALSDRLARRERNEPVSEVFQTEMLCKDRTVRQLETSGKMFKYEGKPALIAAGRDITKRKIAEEKLHRVLESLKRSVRTTIDVLSSALESRDPYTAGHQSRSAKLACAIAEEMGLEEDVIESVRMAGAIHDIGKLSIPSEILSKPSKITKIEFSLIKGHALSGFDMLKNVESPWPLAEIVYQHHERMDGSGYPRNLKADDILLEARILAVADVVEAMGSHRPYRPALGIDTALEEIEKNRGVLYDANVADACLKLFREKGYQLA